MSETESVRAEIAPGCDQVATGPYPVKKGEKSEQARPDGWKRGVADVLPLKDVGADRAANPDESEDPQRA